MKEEKRRIIMESDRLKKAKRATGKLDWEEFVALEKYMRKRRDLLWRLRRAEQTKRKEDEIRNLPSGTKVIHTDTRYEIGGQVGTIVRHLGRGSKRTIIDFGKIVDGYQRWRVWSRNLSADVSEENVKRLNQNKRLGAFMTGVLNKVISK